MGKIIEPKNLMIDVQGTRKTEHKIIKNGRSTFPMFLMVYCQYGFNIFKDML